MSVRRPTEEQLAYLARRLGLGLSAEDVREFHALVDEGLEAHDWVDEEASVAAQRRPLRGRAPTPAENPLGAWYWRTQISSTDVGPLAGKTVAVKDNIGVADVPMMNGSVVLEGCVPEEDATVVQRVLAAGATVAGKAVCESLCYSGGSHTSDSGPVLNPYDHARSSGGSTSGCAALLANGDVDLALGGDQGGSIRGPSSWSGVYGMKPTYGLVPYTGAFPLEMTLDHLGPMARSSADVALLLDVIAGPDGLDPRQNLLSVWKPNGSYAGELDRGVEGLRIGLLQEGFGWGRSEPDVDEAVRAAVHAFGALGAEIVDASVPQHRTGMNLTLGIAAEGSTSLFMHGSGVGTNWRGRYSTAMLKAFSNGLRERSERLPPMVKVQMLMGQWLHDTYGGLCYANAQNLGRRLTQAYDDAFTGVDLLALPTTPMKATLLPGEGISATESAHVAHEMGANTSPFNVSGHPAMSIPCALSNGLPVGMMIVGRRGEDGTVLRAAHAFEESVFRPPPSVSSVSNSEEVRQ